MMMAKVKSLHRPRCRSPYIGISQHGGGSMSPCPLAIYQLSQDQPIHSRRLLCLEAEAEACVA